MLQFFKMITTSKAHKKDSTRNSWKINFQDHELIKLTLDQIHLPAAFCREKRFKERIILYLLTSSINYVVDGFWDFFDPLPPFVDSFITIVLFRKIDIWINNPPPLPCLRNSWMPPFRKRIL